MKAGVVTLAFVFVAAATAAAQDEQLVAQRAESLSREGRPWHAASLLLPAASHGPHANVGLIVQGAEAELAAQGYDRARELLAGQPWLEDYGDGQALAVLGEAEERLGDFADAATHFLQAQSRAKGARAALLAARAGHAWEQAGERDSAARAYTLARTTGIPAIDPWLRVREAGVLRDTVQAFALLAALPSGPAVEVPDARARALLGAGDTLLAVAAFTQAGRSLDVARLALAAGDTETARAALYGLMGRAPESDPAASAVSVATTVLPPRIPWERVALARAMKAHGASGDATTEVERAAAAGDSSGATMQLLGDLRVAGGRYVDAERVYRVAMRDSSVVALATYRRARLLLRIGDPGAVQALSAFARAFPADTAAPSALYAAADALAGRGDRAAAVRASQ